MRTLTLLLPAVMIGFSLNAQTPKRIRLTLPKPRTSLSRIRVTAVTDDRDDTALIGTMRAGIAGKLRAVALEGGTAGAAYSVLSRYQSPSAAAQDLIVHIRRLEVGETTSGSRQRLTISYQYAFAGSQGELSYEGSAYAESSLDVSAYIERLVRESLTSTFDKVADAWQDPATAVPPRVTVSVRIEPQPAATGLISYDPKRPLTIDDFDGQPDDLSSGAAATYTGISFAYGAQQQGSELRVMVSLTPIADPERSWMRPAGRTPVVVAHENLHLAITAGVACRLADSLRHAVLTPEDYDARIRQIVKFFERQVEQEQRRYDLETDHGRKPQQQAQWKERLDAALRGSGCYEF